jgi:hypothetical protein
MVFHSKMRKPDPPPLSSKRGSVASETVPSRQSMAEAPAIIPSSSSSGEAFNTHPQSVAGVKRKKSRVYLPPDGEESEGAQADAEYGGVRNDISSVWINDSRRRSVAHTPSLRRIDGGDELRRHSMAV